MESGNLLVNSRRSAINIKCLVKTTTSLFCSSCNHTGAIKCFKRFSKTVSLLTVTCYCCCCCVDNAAVFVQPFYAFLWQQRLRCRRLRRRVSTHVFVVQHTVPPSAEASGYKIVFSGENLDFGGDSLLFLRQFLAGSTASPHKRSPRHAPHVNIPSPPRRCSGHLRHRHGPAAGRPHRQVLREHPQHARVLHVRLAAVAAAARLRHVRVLQTRRGQLLFPGLLSQCVQASRAVPSDSGRLNRGPQRCLDMLSG